MGDELKWLLKEGGRCIFENCDISLENTPTSHTVSLVQDMYACSDSAMPLLSSACLCKTTVPLYAQSCGCNSKSITFNFITGRGYPRCNQRIGFKGPIQVSSVQHDKLTVSGCTHSGCSRTSKEKPKLDGDLPKLMHFDYKSPTRTREGSLTMKTDVGMVYPKVHKQGREDIKVKVNTQSFIHPYIFFTLRE